MKKHLLIPFLSCLAIASLRADVLYQDTFPYTNGLIIQTGTNTDGTTNWFHHSGSSDAFVKNRRLENATSDAGAPVVRTEDVNRPFTTFTNAFTPLYASFIVNATNLPSGVGSYFAHFFVNSSTFYGRVWALTNGTTLPGTWRLGVSGAGGTGANKVFPVDLATNTDYQVVVYYDPVSTDPIPLVATLWVNPMSSSDANFTTSDPVTSTNILKAFAFRQGASASGAGKWFATISNLVVATTFEEATTNVWASNSIPPYFAVQPKSRTNFEGETVNISAVANGQGISGFSYQWRKDGNNISNPNGNNNIFTIASASISDIGNYDVIASNPISGLSATSAVALLFITNGPPNILQQPANTTVFFHSTATLHVTANGSPTLSYQWYYTNAPATGANVSGANTDTLTITDVLTNNGTTGAYYVAISNPYGNTNSATVTVSAIPPPPVTIAFLRTLVDPVNFTATNSSLRWQATGIVTTSTNLTSGDTSSYYLQDSSGCGINIFVTHGSNFRPNQGDVVTFVGWLSSFNSTLELEADTNDVTTSFTIWSNNVAGLPPQKPIAFNITNNLAFCETNLEGSIVMLTNVYFGTNAGNTISTTLNFPVTVTNANGETFTIFFSPQDLDTAGQTLPAFATSIVGPLTQNLGNAVTPRNAGYQLTVTRFSDLVPSPPIFTEPPRVCLECPSTTLSASVAPYSYAYSVWAANNVTGPYARIASNLHFTTTSGSYTDTTAVASQKFYRISTP